MTVVFKHNRAGYRKILQSDGVAADLQRRANKVKAAIDARYDQPRGWVITADTIVGRNRARALISGVPMAEENAERILGSALDAAR